MVSTNASGDRALKYGTTKDWILGLEVVLADGRVIETGAITPKSSSGFDLTHLFVGSEGTLGVVTEIRVKIIPTPEYVAFAQIRWRNLEDAGRAVTEILRQGIPLSACEILDRVSLDVTVKVTGLDIPEDVGCMLFVQVDGHKAAVQDHMREIDEICTKHNVMGSKWSDDPDERLAIWQARQGLVAALSKVKRGERLIPLVEDFGVPISKIPETIREVQRIGEKHDFPIATFGHVGDGNIHAVLLLDVRKKEHWEKAKGIAQDFIDLALKFKGTLTAEHGTGMAKSPFIGQELGGGQEVMREIKRALDPHGILNPGKMGLDDKVKDIYDYFAFREISVKPIRSYSEHVDNEVLACIQCGFCRLGCPIFAETALESRNARGHVILAFNLMTGAIQPSQELANSFYECTMCLNCMATCPASIMVADIVEGARKRLVEEGYLPEVFLPMLESLKEEGNPFREPADRRVEVYPAGYEARARVPESVDLLLFLGCVGSYQDLYIVPSTMELLDKVGVNYAVLGTEENCCGYVAYLVGSDAFQECMERNIATFSRLSPNFLVTTCAGCYRAFKELYTNLHVEVLHLVEYVERLISEGKVEFKRGFPSRVIYHDPCDMGRHLGLYEPPRKVLKSIPNLELLEFRLNRALAKCCGGGGGLKAYDNGLSSKLADNRVAEALDVGAEVLVSTCPSCKSNLKLAAARLGRERRKRIRVMDITEVLAEAI
jgi:glycolate oxidase